ncbi:hypothetical protein [Geobacter sp. SVR]|uniref:hypothetical protein n=1 Tax=Geobacter sp. SVR TaxID=2495594 RepID=UPI00143EF692|nr:hypothetical protein [Geobacter sp. SVR]BCS52104.1 hypothetical protein GSVR_04120 [Geobacter sp. SVR]GCF86559.1 hypothetical protein GSbR_31590 [Geobacter sp. SVR]
MPHNSNESSLKRLLTVSPWFPLVFFVLPALVVLFNYFPRLRVIPFGPNLLLLNNVAFLALMLLRLVRALALLKTPMPHAGAPRPEGEGDMRPGPAGAVRKELSAAGYCFDESGSFGEKRNAATMATAILYAGLTLAFLVGFVDYSRQYSNVVLLGVGNPMKLSEDEEGVMIGQGFFSSTRGLPQLQVMRQILPSREWPKGATEIVLCDNSNKEVARKIVAWEGQPLVYGGFEFHMGRFLHDINLVITTVDRDKLEFDNFIKLLPMPSPEPPYTHWQRFTGYRGTWLVRYDPVGKAIRLTMKNKEGATLADGVTIFQKDQQKTIGPFVVKIGTMGDWSELHVVRHRHMTLVFAGVTLAFIGLVLRLLFRPQLVWLQETVEGTRVWTAGKGL